MNDDIFDKPGEQEIDKIHVVDLKERMETLHRLRHECYCSQSASGCKRRFETCSEKSSLFHD